MVDPDALKNFENRLEVLQRTIVASAQIQRATLHALTEIKDLLIYSQTKQFQGAHLNPLNGFGEKCFSQADEDGITLEIIRRLGLKDGVYAEFGVGNGLENNTLILAALGWRGFWVGGESLAFEYGKATKFCYIRDWITLENIAVHAFSGMQTVNAKEIDVLSLDLDGNDIYFTEKLLSDGIKPKLFIVEYNAKFPPPARFQITYNPQHKWAGDDYFGAALTNFFEVFEQYGYKLVCCNSHSGANAFFIDTAYADLFNDVPENINDIYVAPRYHLYSSYGHRKSAKVVEEIIKK